MSLAPIHQNHSLADASHLDDRESGAADHTLADDAVLTRDFACWASVTHVTLANVREFRRLPGITGVIDCDDTADLQLLIHAQSARDAKRVCVELVAAAAPDAVVSVPEVVDYETALVDHLDRQGLADFLDAPGFSDLAEFDDVMAIADVLDT